MANIDVDMFLDNSGELDFKPKPVVVKPGDTVRWKSDIGDLIVVFPKDQNPFTVHKQFGSAKGNISDAAVVRSDLPKGKSFECTVTLGGKEFTHASGVDSSGS